MDTPSVSSTVLRDRKTGRILPGSAGLNKQGRPPGNFALAVRNATRDGETLIQLALDYVEGRVPEASASDRLRAAEFLANRGWGKSPETNVNIEVASTEESAQTAANMARDLLVANGVKHG